MQEQETVDWKCDTPNSPQSPVNYKKRHITLYYLRCPPFTERRLDYDGPHMIEKHGRHCNYLQFISYFCIGRNYETDAWRNGFHMSYVTAFLDTTKVIIKKYITDGQQTYGYFTGLTAANQLAITTQVPTHLEICSNIEASKGRTVMVGNRTLRVKRPKIEVTSDNYKILQLLDLIQDAEKWSDLPEQEMVSRLRTRIVEEKLCREELKKCILLYPGRTAQKIIEWELIYEFT